MVLHFRLRQVSGRPSQTDDQAGNFLPLALLLPFLSFSFLYSGGGVERESGLSGVRSGMLGRQSRRSRLREGGSGGRGSFLGRGLLRFAQLGLHFFLCDRWIRVKR